LRDGQINASIYQTMPETNNSTGTERDLTLMLPGLDAETGPEGNNFSLGRLEWLLSRADRVTGAATGTLDECLFRLFGADVPDGRDLPVAAVTRVLDVGVVDNAWWLRADPVHLRPQGDTLVLAASDDLMISQPEADRLIQEILKVFVEDGWVLKAPRPHRWYLQPADTPDMQTTHIDRVLGNNIYPALPTGPDGKKWHTVLNELQILLHTSGVNQERESRGDLPINSLWFWGGGRLPVIQESNWVKYWGDQTVGLALSRLAQVPHSNKPASAKQWLADAGGGHHLVVLDQAFNAKRHGQYERWQNFVAALDETWIDPLIRALEGGELETLTLCMDQCRQYSVQARHLKRWWRRRKELKSYT
jgi:hypothetical protein